MNIPSNTIPYLLGSIATLVIGIKSLQNYQKLKTPLSRHFAFSGFLSAAGLGLYSIPFYLTSNPDVLRISVTLARLCLDIVGYWQVYLIWYLTGLRRFPLRYLIVPIGLIGVVGFVDQAFYYQTNPVGIVDGLAVYKFSDFAKYIHMISLMIVFVAGLVIGINAFQQKDLRSRVRLLSISILYVFASMADSYNTLFLQGLNNSWIVLVGFVIASGVFLSTTLIFNKK